MNVESLNPNSDSVCFSIKFSLHSINHVRKDGYSRNFHFAFSSFVFVGQHSPTDNLTKSDLNFFEKKIFKHHLISRKNGLSTKSRFNKWNKKNFLMQFAKLVVHLHFHLAYKTNARYAKWTGKCKKLHFWKLHIGMAIKQLTKPTNKTTKR